MHQLSLIKKIILGFFDKSARLFFLKKRKISEPLSFENTKKILFIEIWGLGDLVMLSPALMNVRNEFTAAKITLLAKPHASPIFQHDGLVNTFYSFDFPWTKHKGKYFLWKWNWISLFKVIKHLRQEKFDLVFDARGDFRNNLLSFLIGAKRRVGYAWTGGGYFLTDVASLRYKDSHRVEAWLGLLEHMNIKTKHIEPALTITEGEKEWAALFLKSKGVKNGEFLIGMHPGAGVKTRCWPLERFGNIAEKLSNKYKTKIVVFISPDGYAEDFPVRPEYIKVKVPLRQLMALIGRMNILICNDAGPMHIACALRVPLLAIFGPQKPEWFGPRGEKNAIVIHDNVSCRPCFDFCKFEMAHCLTDITETQVYEAATKVMDGLLKVGAGIC